jgi:hypothetical protein
MNVTHPLQLLITMANVAYSCNDKIHYCLLHFNMYTMYTPKRIPVFLIIILPNLIAENI